MTHGCLTRLEEHIQVEPTAVFYFNQRIKFILKHLRQSVLTPCEPPGCRLMAARSRGDQQERDQENMAGRNTEFWLKGEEKHS
ncbi:unnamed protein product [Arctogadus glacialis]